MADSLANHTRASGRGIAEMGITVALAFFLAFFSFAPFPTGGQISLDMLPILVFALVRGHRWGCTAGVAYGFLHIIQEPIILHPVQVLLDYPLAFGALGLCGLPCFKEHTFLGLTVSMLSRYLMHVLSGVIFLDLFLTVGTEVNVYSPWLWSFSYNATFLILPALCMYLLVPPLKHALSVYLNGK
ncbi:energy-coupled thiamine transporter ThiT [bacterium]|nr:energy-coupled thiamine transporter ThiT [bacterium]